MNGSFQIAAIHLAVGNEYCRHYIDTYKYLARFDFQIHHQIDSENGGSGQMRMC